MKESTHTSFRPVSMTKTALALLYFPHSTPGTARKRLMRWVNQCRPLVRELRLCGYTTHQHLLTSRQVRLIVKHLDLP